MSSTATPRRAWEAQDHHRKHYPQRQPIYKVFHSNESEYLAWSCKALISRTFQRKSCISIYWKFYHVCARSLFALKIPYSWGHFRENCPILCTCIMYIKISTGLFSISLSSPKPQYLQQAVTSEDVQRQAAGSLQLCAGVTGITNCRSGRTLFLGNTAPPPPPGLKSLGNTVRNKSFSFREYGPGEGGR